MQSKISHNIKELRLNKNRTQQGMAAELDIKRATIGAWEEGINEPNVSQLTVLCVYFDVTLDAFIRYRIKFKKSTVIDPKDNLTFVEDYINSRKRITNSQIIYSCKN